MAEKTKKNLNKIFEKLKKIKHIEYYVIAIFVLIALFLYFGDFFQTDSAKSDNTLLEYAKSQEEKLENTLSKIDGCGKVKVMITYESGFETIPAYITDKTQNSQEDDNGIISNITERTTVVMAGGKPLIIKSAEPKVMGVIVVAEGAKKPQVKIELFKAVATLLKIDNSCIEIFIMN